MQEVPKHSWLRRGVGQPPNRYGIKPGALQRTCIFVLDLRRVSQPWAAIVAGGDRT